MKIILKVLLYIVLGILALCISEMLFFFILIHSNNTEKGNKTVIMKTDSIAHSKALVVYQPSLMTDSTKNVAYDLAKGLNSKGYDVTIAYPGKYLSTDLSTYKVVVFGSPIYIGQTSSVLNDYIKSVNNLKDQKILLFVTGGADDSEQLNSLEKLFTNAEIPMKISFKYNDKGNENKAFNLGSEIGKE
ncbi:flavodoxin family protein [Clostridium pasteurianum]|uniref:Flavodoxin domain-containing protein n=1 Tax=Clostridium pasteurianum BC1 TaxID=86416 RepID=R4K7E7_CLOPA|nr:flavodoxin domain-containing protein [Clostridium pasteurianum]AGK95540.1 hypothetical protein Clopa_0487 [Clostridium pasteurianum BC1]